MDGTVGQSSDSFPCEFLSRYGLAHKRGGEAISDRAGNLGGWSSEGTEDDTSQLLISPQTTARVPL